MKAASRKPSGASLQRAVVALTSGLALPAAGPKPTPTWKVGERRAGRDRFLVPVTAKPKVWSPFRKLETLNGIGNRLALAREIHLLFDSPGIHDTRSI